MENNPNVNAKIKISDEQFTKHIRAKFVTSRPANCVKYFARGWCYKDCGKADTHGKSLSKTEEKEIFDFLVKVGIFKSKE